MAKQLILGTDVIQLTESLNVAGDKNIEIKADGKNIMLRYGRKAKVFLMLLVLGW